MSNILFQFQKEKFNLEVIFYCKFNFIDNENSFFEEIRDLSIIDTKFKAYS